MEYVSLLDLQLQLKEGLSELFPDRLWVCAEVAAIQARTTGHCYLDLVQSENGKVLSRAKAIIWASRYQFLSRFFRTATGSDLAVGQQVLVEVEVSYSELYGLSLVVTDINPEFTLGDSERKKQETIDSLTQSGLVSRQKELRLCRLPYRLAVISASDAAGYGDFCRHLSENEYGFQFRTVLFPSLMQGPQAPVSICAALEAAALGIDPQTGEMVGKMDAVLILRGGGSPLDLACFDDYSLCKAIALCPIPVFSAIGHDRDFHVADLVSHRSVKTPTALADEFIGIYLEEDEGISRLSSRLAVALLGKISMRQMEVENRFLRVRQALLGKAAIQMGAIDALERRIASADPKNILQRGYAIISDGAGVVRRGVASFAPGSELRIDFADGTLLAEVKEVKRK